MSWFKLDDRFFDNPKIAALSNDAKVAYLEAGTYCARELTDGFVPTNKAKTLARPRVIKELVPGLWEPAPGGYYVHDYLKYNPTREKVLAERAAAQRRMFGLRSGEQTANNERSSGVGTDAPVNPVTPSLSRQPEHPPPEPGPAVAPPAELMVSSDPHNIFREAERMLMRGLSPVECDKLRVLEREHTETTWRYAIREAGELNKRSIRYVERVCERVTSGEPDGRPTNGANPGQSRRPAGANAAERPSDANKRLGIGVRR